MTGWNLSTPTWGVRGGATGFYLGKTAPRFALDTILEYLAK
jgi:hypothetical protein